MALECTLEELFRGRVKRVKITRHVVDANGIFMPEEETLKIKLMPGWKAGTKITFEGKGDDRLGFLPPDVVFVVNEKPHHLFSRDGDNLIHEMEVSLTDALAGCTLSVPLIGRENMWLSFAGDEVICPGYEKVIRGQGMPVPGEKGRKGDFLIRFSVSFPAGLSDERRSEACRILRDCCYS
ncbi:unnamed protein product [Linum tenue]|uniref:Chaperone DnaJ C-terminal domain-containing protein n=2 Tax=Linum tenue TaxID=586396 RepID=A0AAV0LXW2_9ROSI|nr:unnamed protein product [Linum tenue]